MAIVGNLLVDAFLPCRFVGGTLVLFRHGAVVESIRIRLGIIQGIISGLDFVSRWLILGSPGIMAAGVRFTNGTITFGCRSNWPWLDHITSWRAARMRVSKRRAHDIRRSDLYE